MARGELKRLFNHLLSQEGRDSQFIFPKASAPLRHAIARASSGKPAYLSRGVALSPEGLESVPALSSNSFPPADKGHSPTSSLITCLPETPETDPRHQHPQEIDNQIGKRIDSGQPTRNDQPIEHGELRDQKQDRIHPEAQALPS